MKNYILVMTFVAIFFSCVETPKDGKDSEDNSENEINSEENQSEASTEDLEDAFEQLGGLLNMGNENGAGNENDKLPEVEALEKLLQMSGMENQGTAEAFQELLTKDMSSSDLFSTEAIIALLEESGFSQIEMEKLITNPDSLKILIQEANKNGKLEPWEKETYVNKGKLSKEQLGSKNTPTGVSLEEAVLLVQAESGPEATMAKLKKIDSLTGTNIMQKMNLNQAGLVLTDVERKNEPKASKNETEKIKKMKLLSSQLHSEEEALELFEKLEKTERDIASGTLQASKRYQSAIKNRKRVVRIHYRDIKKKSTAAKKKFQQLNPDLYFGEEVGKTYIGHNKKAVYLPLGPLSFADEVIKAYHPQLKTKDVNFVLGETDGIVSFPVSINDSGIYSLGLAGSLTIQFIDNALTDVNGPDLYIFEIGAIEPTDLEISKDGKKWIYVGKIDGGVAEVDIAPFVNKGDLFYYVRLKDLKTKSGEPGADVDAIAAIGAAMRLNLDSKVLFETGKSVLKPAGVTALKELVKSISVLKKGNVILEGHTDDVGSAETNQKLSLARAKSVSAELKKLIPGSDFHWKEIGYGETKPLAENDTDKNRAKNRRVDVLVLPN